MQWSHNTTPRYGQYLTHAHSHITWAVAAMDSCFVLVRTHQHGIARRKGPTEDHRPRRLHFTKCENKPSGIFVKINSRESYEIGDNICFLIIEISGEIDSQSSASFSCWVLLYLCNSQKHRCNTKPQFETTTYLAKKRRVQSIEIRRQTFSVLWVERSVIFQPLAPGL